MALKVAINGFGRIGRCVARVIANRSDIELVAINDLADIEELAYLMRYDTIHGKFNQEVAVENGNLVIGGKTVKVYSEKDPAALRFADAGAEIMLECTGLFLEQSKVQSHLDNGIKKVIFSAPAKDDTPTFVLGVNDSALDCRLHIRNTTLCTFCNCVRNRSNCVRC